LIYNDLSALLQVFSRNVMGLSYENIASLIDHTLLKPEAVRQSIIRLCDEALECSFASVCVNPAWVPLCADILKGSPVAVCTVVGFPLGCNITEVKLAETVAAAADGATEFDMVMHIGRFLEGDIDYVAQDIRRVTERARQCAHSAVIKVILESALLSDSEISHACRIVVDAGADFVKTSTGFGPGGATVHAVRLMREAAGPAMGVKASGGIRDRSTALSMIEAGANRIGTSSGMTIVSTP
jgi:deoxyribose-phosphate aldolase